MYTISLKLLNPNSSQFKCALLHIIYLYVSTTYMYTRCVHPIYLSIPFTCKYNVPVPLTDPKTYIINTMTNKLKMSEYFSKMFEEFWLYFAHRKMAQHASGFLFWKTLLPIIAQFSLFCRNPRENIMK